MSFYFDLGSFYEGIFPLNQYKLRFMLDNLENNGLIIDIACGVGTDVIELYKQGFQVEGLDLEPLMIAQARQNAEKQNLQIKFRQGNMLSIQQLYQQDTVSNILCTGNSLVHLASTKEIKSFLEQSYFLLKKEGNLVIQIINFDRVLDDQVTQLPTIINDKENLTFVRNYEYDAAKHKIKFITQLLADKEYCNTIELIPLRKHELDFFLKQIGFTNLKFYGSFKGEHYQKGSYATIVRAQKSN